MKKYAALLLCMVLIVSLLAGCKSGETEQQTEQQTQQQTEQQSEQQTEQQTEQQPQVSWQEAHPTWLCEDKTTLSVFTYDGVNANYLPPSNDLAFWKWLEDYTNVHIEWEVAPYESYRDVITSKIGGGGDLADIIMLRFPAVKNDAGENGLLLDLSEYWDTCFTNTKAYFEDLGILYKESLSTPDGSLYATATFAHPADNHLMLIYNTNWMKELGAEIPSTLDEFTDLLYKMKEAGDLNGNGKDDEIILTSANVTQIDSVLGNAFNLQTYMNRTKCQAGEDGVVYNEYTTDNMKAYLQYLNKLYTDGILDHEITTMNYDILAEKCATDRVGVYICYGTFAVDYGQLTPAGVDDPTGEYYTLGLPLGSEYNNFDPFYVLDSGFSMHTGVNANCANPEIACRWLDVLYADPTVLEVRCLGWEGETFTWNADGSVTLIPFADGQVWQPENFGGGQISLPYIQTSDILNLPYTDEPWYLEQAEWVVENCKFIPASIPPVSTYTEEENEIRSLYETDLVSGYLEYRDKFIMGEYDVDEKWDEYSNTLTQLGLEEVVAMYQSIYDRTR